MVDTRVKISSVVKNQLPAFIREDFPLVNDFLSEYYKSIESQGLTLDLFKNIDKYIKVDELTNLVDSAKLTENLNFTDDVISVDSTTGFPQTYGFLKIDSEIITYTGITTNTFTGCVRGFSGITSFTNPNVQDELVFTKSEIATHTSGSVVDNLSILFLKEFFKKVKTQITPGFEERELDSNIDKRIFIKQSKNFYESKGTDQSFEILFRALYGENVDVIKPRDFLFRPSDAQYRVTKDLVVEALEGDPQELENRTLFQDFSEDTKAARGAVSKVEKINRGDKTYHVLSLDFDYDKDIQVRGSLFGDFSIHPITKATSSISVGSTVLDVDSTVGFAKSGNLITKHSDGVETKLTYESKSFNQFYGVSGVTRAIDDAQNIRVDNFAYGFIGVGTAVQCKVRVTGVIADLKQNFFFSSMDVGDVIEPKCLGVGDTSFASNNWIYNIPVKYNIESVTFKSDSPFRYLLKTFDKHNFSTGDKISIIPTNEAKKSATVQTVVNSFQFIIEGQGELDLSTFYTVQKVLAKANLASYPKLNTQTTNVQNTYVKDLDLYVASPSIPSYLNEELTVTDRSSIFNGTITGENITILNHGFYTGDSVTYDGDLSISGIFFIKKIDDNTIKIAKSRSNINSGQFVSINESTAFSRFTPTNLDNKTLQSQKLVRKLKSTDIPSEKIKTISGSTGILVNGVEILNYKSEDSIFYGSIEEINVTGGGKDYDIINPPVFSISDSSGSGCSAIAHVEGNLHRIDIIDGGFDYVDDPIITITGGNGQGARAKANTSLLQHSVEFNSIESANLVNLTNNTIGFSSFHKFRDGEQVIYETNGETSVGGLTTSAAYHVSVKDAFTVSVHNNSSDAILGISSVNLTSFGTGIQNFKSSSKKKILKSISIGSSGIGYINQKTNTSITGINTATNIISVNNHNYKNGDLISYIPKGTAVEGLPEGNYYLTKVDDNSFRLSEVGIGSTAPLFYFNNEDFVDLLSVGSGIHEFNYPPISVTVDGVIGVSTLSGQDFDAVLQPVFRGSVKSVFVENGGTGYGSSEILNYNRQPIFTLKSGQSAQLKPIVSNGKITEVLVLNSGTEYNSPPDLEVLGEGKGATIVPVLDNGVIKSVNITFSGLGYKSENTSIIVKPSGSESKFESKSRQWVVNKFTRLNETSDIADDDGVLTEGLNTEFGIQYAHLYSPRKLRRSVFAKDVIDNEDIFSTDLVLDSNGVESLSTKHSPIIGWAYDGNPIYGPYGFESITGGSIKALRSGYKLQPLSSRPKPLNDQGADVFADGFFIDDYVYEDGYGDLDKHNGRFCVTPEFPLGVYAYFTTVNPIAELIGNFKNFFKPEFPYFIGDTYYSTPIDFNLDRKSNQDNFDINNNFYFRNTTPYNLLKGNSTYDYFVESPKIHKQKTVVKSIYGGQVDFVGVVTGGFNYSIGDEVEFDDTGCSGTGAIAKVSILGGKKIHSIRTSSTTVDNVEFLPIPTRGALIGYSTTPHSLKNQDSITISGLNTSFLQNNQLHIAGIQTNRFTLGNAVGDSSVTGIVTYFNVSSSNLVFPFVRENDILGIGTEKVKVLNVESDSSRLRVQRAVESTVSSAHKSYEILSQNPRSLTIISSFDSSNSNFKLNKQLYFNPSETVGISTLTGVGAGITATIENPGIGLSQVFVPSKTLRIPNHGLETGDVIIYNNGGGTSLGVSTDGISSFTLQNNQSLFAAKINDDLVGIATARVGFGNNGTFVGIDSTTSISTLFFTSDGAGVVHSLKTNYSNILKGSITKTDGTVATAATHGLQIDDKVYINAIVGVTTTISVTYNDYNRRLIINPRTFSASNVDVANNSISIINHKLYNGEKIIHTSTSPSGGLIDNRFYFVKVVDNNKIKLCDDYYESLKINSKFVDITSASSGTINPINPQIEVEKNQQVYFDLSDSSLAFTKLGTNYPAFDFNLYTDIECKNIYYTSKNDQNFDVTKSGIIGVESNANLTLDINKLTPTKLFYGLIPTNIEGIPNVKKEVIKDTENLNNNNSLNLIANSLSAVQTITGIGSTTFSFVLTKPTTQDLYTEDDGNFTYQTNSKSVTGTIKSISVTNKGYDYKKLPGIKDVRTVGVTTSKGFGAILQPSSATIGQVQEFDIEDIGFEYSADKTLTPQALVPQILTIDSLSSFDKIGISSVGQYYTIAPDLIVLDGLTKEIIDDVDLEYSLGESEVTIVENSKKLSNSLPTIIPVNNSNGVSIDSIDFNLGTRDVTVTIGASFSSTDEYPFNVGDKVLVENVSVGLGTTGKGYNSSNYNYNLFEITATDPNIGGTLGTVAYSMKNFLSGGDIAGNFDPNNSSGKIIPEKWFPIFGITIKKNEFEKDEIVTSNNKTIGIVNSWNGLSGQLKTSTDDVFQADKIIVGKSSNTSGKIRERLKYNSRYSVGSSSIVRKGWKRETGFLNNNLQRLHDNDYYQYFSYALKSKVELEKWNETVSSLNHTAGFKKFSDLVIETDTSQINSGITTIPNSNLDTISHLDSFLDLNTFNDYDLVTEKTLKIDDNTVVSNEIVFKTKVLQDYIESVGNRVLSIDDFSSEFNDKPRTDRFTAVDLFSLSSARHKKYIVYIQDSRFTLERQIYVVSLLHNNSTAFIQQYGGVYTIADLGSFDFDILGTDGRLLFFPKKFSRNDYTLTNLAFNIEDTISGVGATNLGTSIKINSSTATVALGTTTATNILTIPTTVRSSKINVSAGATNPSFANFEFDELTIVHDGTNVELLEYGQINTDTTTPDGTTGLGEFDASISGGNINVTFTPTAGVTTQTGYNFNTIRIDVYGGATGIGTHLFDTGKVDSRLTTISSSASPTANVVAEYSDKYRSAYYFVSIQDTTNSQYQASEILVVDDGTNVFLTEYGVVQSGGNLGDFTATISSGTRQLKFTPLASANVNVRVFQASIGLADPTIADSAIDLTNASIDSGFGNYTGTETDVKREFNLNHNQLPIFKRNFIGSASTVVDVQNDKVFVPDHYFVTGEELSYTHAGQGAISITSTNIPGVGVTDKLPSSVFVVASDDSNLKFASSAENALKSSPEILNITAVGIGTSHALTSKKQNSKVVVSLDNVIQSPIVSTAVTTTLVGGVDLSTDSVTVAGITSIFGGDLIKINDEIMRVDVVGFGATNKLRVKRPWMGTSLSTHAISDLVTKIDGNFNIVENIINFYTAPIGLTPIGTTSGSPDEVDFIGIATHSTFNGRSFMRSGVPGTPHEPYFKNIIFDDISDQFTGFKTSFNLKSGGQNVTGISTDNGLILINQIAQGPSRHTDPVNVVGNYTLKENAGITSIQFVGTAMSVSSDPNTAGIPVGGVIISVGSTQGFGYQPLVAAGGTAIVSGLGTISSISIGNSGSGYRSGSQPIVNVGVKTASTGTPAIEFIGTAAISNGNIVSVAITNPGTGYTTTNPPEVVFDLPLSYTNIPLVYAGGSSGIGAEATVDIVVGQGSSIIDFKINKQGSGYGESQELTIGVGGTVGIPTNSSVTLQEFRLTIESTSTNTFSGSVFGDLLPLDDISDLFNGSTRSFPIKLNGVQKTIKSRLGSSVNVEDTLLIFINDILQVPGDGYVFEGGSFITFTEAPKNEDTVRILFYQGTGAVDTKFVDILEEVKRGDDLDIYDENLEFDEDKRLVVKVNATDSVDTNVYAGPGINQDETYVRSVTWSKQTEDKFIDGVSVSKSRPLYEPLIFPSTNLIQPVGLGSTVAFVENVRTFFDNAKENTTENTSIRIISQDSIVSASATAVVSGLGTISSIQISNAGAGYTASPSVTIGNPVGLGSTQRGSATASISSGSINSISVTNPGTGYTSSNPPEVLISEPKTSGYVEDVLNVTYSGDFGIISGVSTTTVGVSTGIVFDLLLPSDSLFRNSDVVGTAITVSGIQTGYYFVVSNSNIGNGVTSLSGNGVVGSGNSFLDNIYEVSSVSIAQTHAVSIGQTFVAKVTVSVESYNGLTGLGHSEVFGEYSWGRIQLNNRSKNKVFTSYNNGLLGISTSPIVERTTPLKSTDYNE